MLTLFCLTLFLQQGLEGSSLTFWLFNSQWRKVQSCYYVIFSLQASVTLPDFCCCCCCFTVLTKKAIKKITSSWFCRFNKCIALELGAGLGLCSIVLGRVANKVFCTGMLTSFSTYHASSSFGNNQCHNRACMQSQMSTPVVVIAQCLFTTVSSKGLVWLNYMAWGTCEMIEIINKSFMLVYFICPLFYGSKRNMV